jgi:excisionase family DNA binding protein
VHRLPGTVGQGRYRCAVPRFLTLSDVAEVLNITASQAYALVRNGDLPAVKIGGRGQWRIEESKLEEYIQRMYDDTARFVRDHPFTGAAGLEEMSDPELA